MCHEATAVGAAQLPMRENKSIETHQAKVDRAPRSRQCLISALRSLICPVWRLGPGAGAHRGGLNRSIAPARLTKYILERKRTSLRLRLACRSGAPLIPNLAIRYGWPILAMH